MPAEPWGWRITPAELEAWTLLRQDSLWVIDKPAGVACHRSKQGTWSSLAGACREYLGAAKLHMPFRLDRETSGVMLVTGDAETGRRLQRAVLSGCYRKQYVALLEGELRGRTVVNLNIGPATGSTVRLKRAPVRDTTGQSALTVFSPILGNKKGTLATVTTATGRLHQVRVHAAAIGHAIFGDKIYGVDENLFVEFIESGWTERLAEMLVLPRHALHCAAVEFSPETEMSERHFQAPLARDLLEFCGSRLELADVPLYFDFE